MEKEKNYRERRIQLNKPVQCGGNSNVTGENFNAASMWVARIRIDRDVRENDGPRQTPALCLPGKGGIGLCGVLRLY